MYGLVNQSIESYIRMTHGEAVWAAVRRAAGVEVEFVGLAPYPDEISAALLQAASAHLGLPVADLLRGIGHHFIRYTSTEGYGNLLKTSGRTFLELVQQLDQLHSRVGLIFPELRPPSFYCTSVTDSTLCLHYISSRPGLAPMVVGLLEGLGELYATDVRVVQTARRDEGADHDQFQVTFG